MRVVIVRCNVAPSYVSSVVREEGDDIYLLGEDRPFRKNRKGLWFLDFNVSADIVEKYKASLDVKCP